MSDHENDRSHDSVCAGTCPGDPTADQELPPSPTALFSLLGVLASLLACLLGLWWLERRRTRFWADRGVPHVPPHPVLGNFDCIFRKNVGIWIRDLHDKFRAPLLGIWVFRQPVLVVADANLARRVLITDSEVFRNRSLGSGKSDPIGALNIFSVDDPIWSNVRRRLTYIFTAAKLKSFHGLVSSKARGTVDRIRQDNANNQKTDLRNLFTDYTTDVFGTFAFGIENNAVETGDSPIRAVTKDFMKYSWFRGMGWYCIFFWPALVDIFGFTLFPKKTVAFFRETVNRILEQRATSKIEKNDLLDALLKMKKEGLDDGQEFSDDLLVAQAAIMLQGGFDTNATALTLIVSELAHKPEIQDKLYKELIEAKEGKGNGEFKLDDLEKLTYLNCVIAEGLRKYPPMGWLDRQAATDYRINDSLTIPAGTPVYVNAIGMHHDARYFPDPYEFNPDRFLPEHRQDIVPFSYLPFGDGPRVCIGKRFGQMSMRYMLSELVLHMRMAPLPGSPKPRDIHFETKGLFLFPDRPLSVQFIPRK